MQCFVTVIVYRIEEVSMDGAMIHRNAIYTIFYKPVRRKSSQRDPEINNQYCDFNKMSELMRWHESSSNPQKFTYTQIKILFLAPAVAKLHRLQNLFFEKGVWGLVFQLA